MTKIHGAYMLLNGIASKPLSELHYNNLADFSGTVYFYNLNNNFSNGYVLNKGEVVEVLSIAPKDYVSTIKDLKSGIGNKAGERLMYVAPPGDNCNYQIADVFQEFCSTIYVDPATIAFNKNTETLKDKLLSTNGGTTTCVWRYVGSFDILRCGGAPAQQPLYNPHTATGGSSANTEAPNLVTKTIRTDSSISNNEKAKCALSKLLNKNTKFDSLIKAFTGAGYNLTFQVKDLQPAGYVKRKNNI
ncbi:hypothetical protein [Pedobacter sp. Leaf176]|uniref:hypothetical protein n=1 Tax=Pedobacter sp. Leaf176 TaxID=1736286 RepID=UPI0012FAD3D3|nr:hypothetical protein [Pedobacter sp. Leaf176]